MFPAEPWNHPEQWAQWKTCSSATAATRIEVPPDADTLTVTGVRIAGDSRIG